MSEHRQGLQKVNTLNQFFKPALSALQSQILRDTGVVFGANLAARGLSFLFFILAARWLSVSEYGVVKYTISWAAALCVLTAPFSLAWTRALAGQVQQHDSAAWTLVGLRAFILLLTCTLLVGSIWVWADRQLDWSAILVLVGLSIFYAYEGYLNGQFAFSKLAGYMVLGNGFQLSVLWVLRQYVPSVLSPTTLLSLYGIAFIIPVIVVDQSWCKFSVWQRVRHHDLLKTLIKSALALAIVHNAHSLMMNLDIILLGYFCGESQVGYYGVAKTILTSILVLTQAAFTVILPTSARAKEWDKKRLIQTTELVLLIALLLVCGGVILAPQIVRLLFSDRYEPAVPALRVLIIGGWFYSVLMLLAAQGLGQKRDGIYGKMYVVALGVNVVLDLALLPLFGAIGAAWGFLLSSFAGGVLALIEQRRFPGLIHQD